MPWLIKSWERITAFKKIYLGLFSLLYQFVKKIFNVCPAVVEHVKHIHQLAPHGRVLKLLLEQEEIILLPCPLFAQFFPTS